MSKELEWFMCPYCKKEKYCSAQVQTDHLEDCPQRPGKSTDSRPCPKCDGALVKVGKGVLCTNEGCDYQLGIIGGTYVDSL